MTLEGASHATRVGAPFRVLRRVEQVLDASAASQTQSGAYIRRALSLIFAAYAVMLEVTGVAHGQLPIVPLVLLMMAVALFLGRGGRFLHYFVPVLLGVMSYALAGRFVQGYKLSAYYTPQIELEKLLPGPLPTLWLQHHLYSGKTGPLEVFSLSMYLSHFWIPLALGFAFALTGRGRAFATLMFSLLAVSILAEITFILAPTAPPWLAAQKGYLPPVSHVLKNTLYDLHFTKLADLIGDPHRYDVTAAVPSLHIAFPLLCIFVVVRFGLPRWVAVALILNTLGVLFAIVYMGEHYLVDAIAGALYAVVAWWLVTRLYGREPATDRTPAVDRQTADPAPAPTS